MKEIFGSQTKVDLLCYLGLRGASTGRSLARQLNASPTPIFKALRQLTDEAIILKMGQPSFYALNPHYRYYDEIIRMIYKSMDPTKTPTFLPDIPEERRIDVIGIYELLAVRGTIVTTQKLSDRLRERYA